MNTSVLETFADNDLPVDITVKDNDGDAQNLTGATVEASAVKGSTKVMGEVTITDAPGGVVNLVFSEGLLSEGIWTVQLRVTIGDITQTVYSEDCVVKKSAF